MGDGSRPWAANGVTEFLGGGDYDWPTVWRMSGLMPHRNAARGGDRGLDAWSIASPKDCRTKGLLVRDESPAAIDRPTKFLPKLKTDLRFGKFDAVACS